MIRDQQPQKPLLAFEFQISEIGVNSNSSIVQKTNCRFKRTNRYRQLLNSTLTLSSVNSGHSDVKLKLTIFDNFFQ